MRIDRRNARDRKEKFNIERIKYLLVRRYVPRVF